MNPHLDFLLSAVYDRSTLHADHLADLRKSGLTDDTITLQKIRSVPPSMIDLLLGFRARGVRSAYLIPFADPRGGWMDHVKLKVFNDEGTADVRGDRVEQPRRVRWLYNGGVRKYLGRRAVPPRLFFPLGTLDRVLRSDEPLYLCEGEKKGLCIAQLSLASIGFESAWGWHAKGSRDLLPDFDDVGLVGRVVEIVPDSDWQTNPSIERSIRQLADALRHRGARARVVIVPPAFKGIDDYLVSRGHPHGA
jgi:hypothetical protein